MPSVCARLTKSTTPRPLGVGPTPLWVSGEQDPGDLRYAVAQLGQPMKSVWTPFADS